MITFLVHFAECAKYHMLSSWFHLDRYGLATADIVNVRIHVVMQRDIMV
jgi:hypothetical protein